MAQREYATSDGQKVPSVTQVLQTLAKPALYRWYWKRGVDGIPFEQSREADLGTLVHALGESRRSSDPIDANVVSGVDLDMLESAEACDKRIADWESSVGFELERQELSIVDDGLRVGGTMDIIAKVMGRRYLIDLKTGKDVYDEHAVQLAAYLHLYERDRRFEWTPIDRVAILHAPVAGDSVKLVEVSKKQIEAGWQVFTSLMSVREQISSIKLSAPWHRKRAA